MSDYTDLEVRDNPSWGWTARCKIDGEVVYLCGNRELGYWLDEGQSHHASFKSRRRARRALRKRVERARKIERDNEERAARWAEINATPTKGWEPA